MMMDKCLVIRVIMLLCPKISGSISYGVSRIWLPAGAPNRTMYRCKRTARREFYSCDDQSSKIK
jgi:hypothetical protein